MNPPVELHTTAFYASVIRPYLPQEAFRPHPEHLIRIALHIAIVVVCYFYLRAYQISWISLLISLALGHSMACLLFLAHDVSHNSVVRNRLAKRGLEISLWGINLIPPSLWRRVHNQTHHVETNTIGDPDRVFRKSEETRAAVVYNRLFFPNRKTPLRHPFILFHFTTYIARHVWTALLPGTAKPSIVTAKPGYTASEKRAIVVELAIIFLLQVVVWIILRENWQKYLLAVPLPLLVASSVAMSYIFTNHFLNPLCEHSDPLIGSTSVIVPKWVDWLHDNFSYHTEHHVFPGMNPRYFPKVSVLLAKHFPDCYQRIPFGEAWRRLWLAEEFISENPVKLINPVKNSVN
jgi:fatty acid desaturase